MVLLKTGLLAEVFIIRCACHILLEQKLLVTEELKNSGIAHQGDRWLSAL